MESNEESYSSLQQDWRKEIQDIFEELKTKEQVKKLFNVTSVVFPYVRKTESEISLPV